MLYGTECSKVKSDQERHIRYKRDRNESDTENFQEAQMKDGKISPKFVVGAAPSASSPSFTTVTFAQDAIEYLGHVISGAGVSAEPKKIEAMWKWPNPKDATALLGVLGLTGYYRRFVQDYEKISKPLTQLLRKNTFQWTEEAQQAFTILEEAVPRLPTLAIPDFSKPFVVETDASRDWALSLLESSLVRRAQNKSVYERELMVVVQAVHKWKHYLLGAHFMIVTDQKSLKFLTEQKLLTEEQFKWASKLIGFDFEIRHRPGRENIVADALSRFAYFSNISILLSQKWEGWEEEICWLTLMPILFLRLEKEDCTTKVNVLSTNSSKIPTIIKELHETPIGGHSGSFRTLTRVADVLYWEGMRKDIKTCAMQCEVTTTPTNSNTSLVRHLHGFYWRSTKSKGKRHHLCGGGQIHEVSHPYSAMMEVAQLFVKEVVRLHGFPSSIQGLSPTIRKPNGGCELLSRDQFKVHYRHSTKQWPTRLPWVEFWFNTNYNASSQMTTFKALYGCDPPLILQGTTIPSKAARDEILKELKENLCKAQEKNKLQDNKHRRAVVYNESDWNELGRLLTNYSLPEHNHIHPIFHVSLLKPARSSEPSPQPLPPMLSEEYMLEVTPEKLLDTQKNAAGEMEALPKWQQLPESEYSWESAAVISTEFPDFHLEDKVKLQGWGIDRFSSKFYTRRNK
ncbi:hypothetical protein V8G54_031963 [Vigna mungo]|uniref:Chromo domain-containing protein n=1 Tax=Vigna mungo TaxID=3915 RepID=A0AAQ3RID8_VIGMU